MRKVAVVAFFFIVTALEGFGPARAWVGATSSNWFDADNWNPPGVPASTDSVAITNFGTIVITGDVVIASLELRRATLVASNRVTITNLLVAEGARLNAWLIRPTPVTNPPAGSGVVEIPTEGTF